MALPDRVHNMNDNKVRKLDKTKRRICDVKYHSVNLEIIGTEHVHYIFFFILNLLAKFRQ